MGVLVVELKADLWVVACSGGVTFMMWILRYVVFDLQESSKYLIAKGRDEDAIQVRDRHPYPASRFCPFL